MHCRLTVCMHETCISRPCSAWVLADTGLDSAVAGTCRSGEKRQQIGKSFGGNRGVHGLPYHVCADATTNRGIGQMPRHTVLCGILESGRRVKLIVLGRVAVPPGASSCPRYPGGQRAADWVMPPGDVWWLRSVNAALIADAIHCHRSEPLGCAAARHRLPGASHPVCEEKCSAGWREASSPPELAAVFGVLADCACRQRHGPAPDSHH